MIHGRGLISLVAGAVGTGVGAIDQPDERLIPGLLKGVAFNLETTGGLYSIAVYSMIAMGSCRSSGNAGVEACGGLGLVAWTRRGLNFFEVGRGVLARSPNDHFRLQRPSQALFHLLPFPLGSEQALRFEHGAGMQHQSQAPSTDHPVDPHPLRRYRQIDGQQDQHDE